MKPLAMLVVILSTAPFSSQAWWIAFGPMDPVASSGTVVAVDCGTPTVVVPALSTGPFTLKAVSGDCFSIPFINNNGTLPKSPADWVRCP